MLNDDPVSHGVVVNRCKVALNMLQFKKFDVVLMLATACATTYCLLPIYWFHVEIKWKFNDKLTLLWLTYYLVTTLTIIVVATYVVVLSSPNNQLLNYYLLVNSRYCVHSIEHGTTIFADWSNHHVLGVA